MSLPACQERILSGIENALRAGEPRLASRFAIFARLASGEELPRTEQLEPQSWRRRALASAGRAYRFLVPRPQPPGGAAGRAPGRPAARLRAAVVLPVLLIMMASATAVTAIAGTRACARAPTARPSSRPGGQRAPPAGRSSRAPTARGIIRPPATNPPIRDRPHAAPGRPPRRTAGPGRPHGPAWWRPAPADLGCLARGCRGMG